MFSVKAVLKRDMLLRESSGANHCRRYVLSEITFPYPDVYATHSTVVCGGNAYNLISHSSGREKGFIVVNGNCLERGPLKANSC